MNNIMKRRSILLTAGEAFMTICRAVSAEYGLVPLRDVLEFFRFLEKAALMKIESI